VQSGNACGAMRFRVAGNRGDQESGAEKDSQRRMEQEKFMSASVRGCEPKATVAAISGDLNGLGVKCVSMQMEKMWIGITAGYC
jgi:hypothetical protein